MGGDERPLHFILASESPARTADLDSPRNFDGNLSKPPRNPPPSPSVIGDGTTTSNPWRPTIWRDWWSATTTSAGWRIFITPKTSLDTKDVCVIWGDNVATEDFHRVKFWNGPWTCNWRYPDGVRATASQVSNNHLITQSDAIRQTIARVRVGTKFAFGSVGGLPGRRPSGILARLQLDPVGHGQRRLRSALCGKPRDS